MSVIACMSSRFHVTPTLTHLHLASIVTVYSVLLLFVPTYISSKCILYHFICSFELKTVNRQELSSSWPNKGSSFNIFCFCYLSQPNASCSAHPQATALAPNVVLTRETTRNRKLTTLICADQPLACWIRCRSTGFCGGRAREGLQLPIKLENHPGEAVRVERRTLGTVRRTATTRTGSCA